MNKRGCIILLIIIALVVMPISYAEQGACIGNPLPANTYCFSNNKPTPCENSWQISFDAMLGYYGTQCVLNQENCEFDTKSCTPNCDALKLRNGDCPDLSEAECDNSYVHLNNREYLCQFYGESCNRIDIDCDSCSEADWDKDNYLPYTIDNHPNIPPAPKFYKDLCRNWNDCDNIIDDDPQGCPTNFRNYNPGSVDCSKKEFSKCAKCINTKAKEICDDNVDNDCDGKFDCADEDCNAKECINLYQEEGICIDQLCINGILADLKIENDYLDHLPVVKNEYLEEVEIPKYSGETHLIISPYDHLYCEARFKGNVAIGQLSNKEKEKIKTLPIPVEFTLQGPGSTGPTTNKYKNCGVFDSRESGGKLYLVYKCSHIFKEVKGENRGKQLHCAIFPRPSGEITEPVRSKDVVVAKYLYYFVPINQESYGNLEEWWDYYLELSEVNSRTDLAGKKIKVEAMNISEQWPENLKWNPLYDVHTVIVNSNLVGGGASRVPFPSKYYFFGLWKTYEKNPVIMVLGSKKETLAHELGHYIGLMIDEYNINEWWKWGRRIGFKNPISENEKVRFPECCLAECYRKGGLCLSSCSENGFKNKKTIFGREYSCGGVSLECCTPECNKNTDCGKNDESCGCGIDGKCFDCSKNGGFCSENKYGKYCDYSREIKSKAPDCFGTDSSCYLNRELECVDCVKLGMECVNDYCIQTGSNGLCGSPHNCPGMPYRDDQGKNPHDETQPFGDYRSIMGSPYAFGVSSNKIVYPENAVCPLKNC